ncbi:unnamed protein product [Closterium sp. NIES-54]
MVDLAMMSCVNKEDLRKLIPKELYPSWVQFPEFERVEWINYFLRELWPKLREAISGAVMMQIGPVLESYRPPMISSLKLTKFNLGRLAPQLGGIDVVETRADEVVLHVDFNWVGDPSIILAIKTVVGVALQVQVKNLQIWGVFRVALTPLIPTIPCFGAIVFAFTKKANSVNPLWNHSFEFTVEDAETQRLVIKVWDDQELTASLPVGQAAIVLADLPPLKLVDRWVPVVKDVDDPKADTRPRGSLHLELLYRPVDENGLLLAPAYFTPPAPKTLQEATAAANAAEARKTRQAGVGFLSPIKAQQQEEGEGGGDVPAMALGGDLGGVGVEDGETKYMRGVLQVALLSGRELMACDMNGLSDPFAVLELQLGGQRRKSRVVKKTLEPEWNENFEFLVEDGKHDMLVVALFDHDLLGKKDNMGRRSSSNGSGSGAGHYYHYYQCDSPPPCSGVIVTNKDASVYDNCCVALALAMLPQPSPAASELSPSNLNQPPSALSLCSLHVSFPFQVSPGSAIHACRQQHCYVHHVRWGDDPVVNTCRSPLRRGSSRFPYLPLPPHPPPSHAVLRRPAPQLLCTLPSLVAPQQQRLLPRHHVLQHRIPLLLAGPQAHKRTHAPPPPPPPP